MLLISSKKEYTGLGRSIAISSLGIFLYQELQNRSNHPRLRETVNVLIAGTRVGFIFQFIFLYMYLECMLIFNPT